MYFNNKYSNHNCNNVLYFMLGAATTAMSCMGYCLCKNQKDESSQHNHYETHQNNDMSNLIRHMHKQMCRNNHKHKCHQRHSMHNHVSHDQNMSENIQSNDEMNNTFE